MKTQRVLVLGGTGFVGHHLVYALSAARAVPRVVTRRPERHRDLRLVPGCELVQVERLDREALAPALEGCTALVNLVGILNESAGRTFATSHVGLVEEALAAAERAGVQRYLHMSALNADADRGPSTYLKTKGQGESVARAAAGRGMAVTIFRPSVIFGPGDSFFNRFAGLLGALPGPFPFPVPFPLACADARFAPVYVGDLVRAMMHCLAHPETAGETYELCGPRVFTLRELVEYTAARLGRRIRVTPLSDRLARLQAQVFQYLPGKPFTLDNYLSLQVPSLCGSDGLGALGIAPTDIEAVVPRYLGARR